MDNHLFPALLLRLVTTASCAPRIILLLQLNLFCYIKRGKGVLQLNYFSDAKELVSRRDNEEDSVGNLDTDNVLLPSLISLTSRFSLLLHVNKI